MQSSYKVIKRMNAVNNGDKEIRAEFIMPKEIIVDTKHNDPELEPFEKIATSIIDNAQRTSRNILEESYKKAKEIEDKAIESEALAKENGFTQGYNEGKEIGYSEGFEDGFKKGEEEGNKIIQNAKFILLQAKEEYERFIKEKEVQFRDLIISTTESILKREVKNPDSFNSLIFDVLNSEKNRKSFIIKCNSIHYAAVQGEILDFKSRLAFQDDIFVIEDNLMNEDVIIIEKDNGVTTLSVEYSLEKLKEILMES